MNRYYGCKVCTLAGPFDLPAPDQVCLDCQALDLIEQALVKIITMEVVPFAFDRYTPYFPEGSKIALRLQTLQKAAEKRIGVAIDETREDLLEKTQAEDTLLLFGEGPDEPTA